MIIRNTARHCLNLSRRPDRRLREWSQFRREELKVKRLEAPDAFAVAEARSWRNKGMRACALAHRLAWREGRQAGAGATLVFEDDVVLCCGFRQRLEALELPDDWGILYFGCVMQTPPKQNSIGLLRIRGPVLDMHAYLIRSEFAAEVSREYAGVSCQLRSGIGLADSEVAKYGEDWWSHAPKERGKQRREDSNDTMVPHYFGRYAAYTDFDQGKVRIYCEWEAVEVSPGVVHFAGHGKADPAYTNWLDRCVRPSGERELECTNHPNLHE